MAIYCSNCRYFEEVKHGIHIAYCGHPDAATFDRVSGYGSPIISGQPFVSETKKKTLKDCDEFGRHEERIRPWWRFWP